MADRLYRTVLRVAAAHPDQTVALFTHSTAIRCLLSAVRGKHPFDTPELGHCENTGVSCLEVEDGQVRVVFENDASHLPAELTATRQREVLPRFSSYQVWFRPMDPETEGALYIQARRDAWTLVYGSAQDFDGPAFLAEARAMQAQNGPRSLECVMLQDQIIGVLQMDFARHAEEGAGYIPFLYLKPEYRRLGVGVQLVGEAVCGYRAMGRRRLRLRCAAANEPAQRFYHKYGFQPVGQEVGGRSGALLDLLELDIT